MILVILWYYTLGKYQIFPTTLFRIGSKSTKLRDYDVQMAKKSQSFDYITKDGLIHPAVGDYFEGKHRGDCINLF